MLSPIIPSAALLEWDEIISLPTCALLLCSLALLIGLLPLTSGIGAERLPLAQWWSWKGTGTGTKTRKDGDSSVLSKSERSNDIHLVLERLGKRCVVFFGSQSGTAENLASLLAKEAKSRFGLEAMVADLEEYTYEGLCRLPPDTLCIFVLATYGDGEPTDNAAEFYNFLLGKNDMPPPPWEGDERPLRNMQCAVFGLGNRTYAQFNKIGCDVHEALVQAGADCITELGAGDEGAGTTEDDFEAWKEQMWTVVANSRVLDGFEAASSGGGYDPGLIVTIHEDVTANSPMVYLGEANGKHLDGKQAFGPFNVHNPYLSQLTQSRILTTGRDRVCLHMDLELSHDLQYQTGDHIAIWPMNQDEEVSRLLRVFGWTGMRSHVLQVSSADGSTRVPIPTPTTLEAAFRFYLDVSAPVPRHLLRTLALYAPTAEAGAELTRLGKFACSFGCCPASPLFPSWCVTKWTWALG